MKRIKAPDLFKFDRITFDSICAALYEENLLERRPDQSIGIADTFDELEFSFLNLGRVNITLPALAKLALLVREVASGGKPVRLILPSRRAKRTRLQWFLANIGFADLFESPDSGWQDQVEVVGELRPFPFDGAEEQAHYLKFDWFDRTWFEFAQKDDPYQIEPQIAAGKEDLLRRLLTAQGFVEPDAIDTVINVLFLELAWNSVLHSGTAPLSGFGLISAQIRHSPSGERHLTFAISDSGVGIPQTLATYYAASDKNYETEYSCSRETAIVRCSIDPASSSRIAFPSERYRAGDRGLARVANSIRPAGMLLEGSLDIVSRRGHITLDARDLLVHPITDDSFADRPALGTHVSISVKVRTDRRVVTSPAAQFEDLVSAASYGTTVFEDNSRPSEVTARSIDRESKTLIIDIGYHDDEPRYLESVIADVVESSQAEMLIAWSVRTQRNQLDAVIQLLKNHPRGIEAIFVRSADEAYWVPAIKTSGGPSRPWHPAFEMSVGETRATLKDKTVPIRLNALTFSSLNQRVNSFYLRRGFDLSTPARGFFRGRIHLLSAHDTPVFFSLARNVEEEAELRRWANTCSAALSHLLELRDESEAEPVLLALGTSTRPVLQRALETLRLTNRAYSVMTYDIPTTEELAAAIAETPSVILVTDVLSAGSLLDAARKALERIEKRVLGVAVLVHARELSDGTHQLPPNTVIGSVMPDDFEFGTREWWVDPVSLVPSETNLFSSNPDPRIEDTLDALKGAQAVRCGHIVDGVRHMSVFVDVAALIQQHRHWLSARINEEIDRRQESRGWTNFRPTLILSPSGISRLDPVHAANSPPEIFESATQQYNSILSERWQDAELREIPRMFDPGGRPRCARHVETAQSTSQRVDDVVVADDCMWTGGAATQLVQLAASLGAKRVLVVPLLARMTPDKVQHWESLAELSMSTTHTELCFAFPLVLPIPFYGPHECPYEITIAKLRRATERNDTLRAEEARVSKLLIARAPVDSIQHSDSYIGTWVRLRVLAELASEDESALNELIGGIRGSWLADERLACLNLFLEDWALLGRNRLRQIAIPALRDLTIDVFADRAASVEELVAASSLLRSMAPDDFVKWLPQITEAALADLELLGRVAMHVATLPTQLQSTTACRSFLERVATHNWTIDALVDPGVERLAAIVEYCDLLAVSERRRSSEPKTPRQAAIALLTAFERDVHAIHDARSIVQVLSEKSLNVSDWSQSTVSRFVNRWQDHRNKIFDEVILPLLGSLEKCILLATTQGSHLATAESEYFLHVTDATNPLSGDLAGISFGLRALSENRDRTVILRRLSECAKRLHQYVLGRECHLEQVVNSFRGPTLAEVSKVIIEELQTTLSVANLEIQTINPELADRRSVFCPPDTFWPALLSIVDNIRRHAFKQLTKKPRIGIEWQLADNDGDPSIVFRFLHNDGQAVNIGPPSRTTIRHDSDLRQFGGGLSFPMQVGRGDWKVAQEMQITLW